MFSTLRKMMVIAVLACASAAVQARPPHDAGNADERNARAHDERELDRAVGQVRRETHGRVLSADVDEANEDRSYRIKVLTPGGRVRTITVDEESQQ